MRSARCSGTYSSSWRAQEREPGDDLISRLVTDYVATGALSREIFAAMNSPSASGCTNASDRTSPAPNCRSLSPRWHDDCPAYGWQSRRRS